MKIAIHTTIDEKPSPEDRDKWESLVSDFQNVDFTIEELATSIGKGHSFCAQHIGRRVSKNFKGCGFLSVDIDNGMTLQEALENEFILKNAAIVYATQNHTLENNRFRIVFALEREIQNAEEMKCAYQGIIRKFGGDNACKDACRFFFGSKSHEPIVLGNMLPDHTLDQIIKMGEKKRSQAEPTREAKKYSVTRSESRLPEHAAVVTAKGEIRLVSDLSSHTAVHCPQHEDRHASAHIVQSKSGVRGIHCSTCSETFWPKSSLLKQIGEYDFYEIDRDLQAIEFDEDPLNYLGEEAPLEYFSNEARVVRSAQSKQLSPISLVDGVTLIRSPKGSGKTHQLKRIVAKCREKNLSVLLIGHRQSLVSALCAELELNCYLDRKTNWDEPIPVSKYYGICLDSVPSHLNLKKNKYDVVIIDESEQVFSHITSETLKNQRRECFLMLQKYIGRARTVIACDADLSYLTLVVISTARGDSMPTAFYVNRYKEEHRDISVYDSESQLLGELLESVGKGKKCYVCCNSKKQAKTIRTMLLTQNPNNKIMLITGENSGSAESIKFVKNIKEEILLYDVVISSPTLGTGIDITFPDSEKKIDEVYGFFHSNINTHFDIDQQLCRVRHPKSVKVWISKERLFYETEPSVIKRNCVEAGYVIDAQIGFDDDDNKVYAEDDDLVSLYAEVISRQRASKNNLRRHFVDLKKFNGWTVAEIVGKNADSVVGATARAEARVDERLAESQQICSAGRITQTRFSELLKEDSLSPQQLAEVRRYAIETFYGRDISPELVILDANGKFRDQIKLFQLYLTSDEQLKQWDYKQSGDAAPDRDGFLRKKNLLREIFDSSSLTDKSGRFKHDALICSDDLTEFTRLCKRYQYEITSMFGIKPRADMDRKPISYLKELLDLIGVRWGGNIKKDVGGRRFYYYWVDQERMSLSLELARKRMESSSYGSSVFWSDDKDANEAIVRIVNKSKRRGASH